jgi:hypothetical protein
MKNRVCVICKEKFYGWGNNAMPVKKGQCCDSCNDFVILTRIKNLKEYHEKFNKVYKKV